MQKYFDGNKWIDVSGAKIEVDSAFSETSTNALQNKVITLGKQNKIYYGKTAPADPQDNDIWVYKTDESPTNSFLPLSGGIMTGPIDMGSNKITSTATPTANKDLTNKQFVDSVTTDKLPLAGGTMTGDIVANPGATGFIKAPNNTDVISIFGGDNILGGASLWLNGLNRSHDNAGKFMLGASDGTTFKWLVGGQDGSLNWNNNNIYVMSKEELTTSHGNIHAARYGNLVIIDIFDLGYNYSSGVENIGTVTLPTGWKIYDDGHRSTIVGDDGSRIKCWNAGAGSSTIILQCWATSARTIYLGNAQLIVPIYKEA